MFRRPCGEHNCGEIRTSWYLGLSEVVSFDQVGSDKLLPFVVFAFLLAVFARQFMKTLHMYLY